MKMMVKFIFAVFCSTAAFGFTYQAHQNMAEDGLLYMESYGSNQMRWAYEYLKAKANGRLYEPGNGTPSSVCYDYNDPGGHGTGSQTTGSDNQCGIMGMGRGGAIAPDFFRDNWWDDTTGFDYKFEISGLTSNNFTSWSHFINLLTASESGVTLWTKNHNDYDGYSYNANYGFPGVGIDYVVATYMNNAWMTIDLPGCTSCSGSFAPQSSGNPAIDYRQNGSTTPVKNPGNGGKRSAVTNGSNYNCFSDVNTTGNCPDEGTDINNNRGSSGCFGLCWNPPPNPYQKSNVYAGAGHTTEGDEDWMIYEPADNTSTFFFNEMFLEGNTSRITTISNWDSPGTPSLSTAAVANRYYNMSGSDIIYLAIIMHWAGDMNQQSHIWSTIGYNHGEYEQHVDDSYGARTPLANVTSSCFSGTAGQGTCNWENFDKVAAFHHGRVHNFNSTIPQIYMEQALNTYRVRQRSNYDTMTSTSTTVWDNAGKFAVNNTAAMAALLYEKGVLDLRKYR